MKKVLIIFLIIFTVGCAKKHVQQDDIYGEKAESEVIADEVSMSEKDIWEIDLDDAEVIKEIDRVFKDALFDYDKYNIRADARYLLDTIASWLTKNHNTKVIIEGHCDERGTNEYNLALGERRAKAARDYLVSLGISSSRMTLITYGEEKPTCTAHSESCWQDNRRAHFVVTE